MTTRVLFLDDNRDEIQQLIQASYIPAIRRLDLQTTISVQHFAQNVEPPSGGRDILKLEHKHPNSRPSVPAEIAQWDKEYALFIIDLCWDSLDKKNLDGAKFAKTLRDSGVSGDRIVILTNNEIGEAFINAGMFGDGDTGHCLKANATKLARFVFNALARPTRRSIPDAEKINGAINRQGQPIERFFHTGIAQTKEQVISACDSLQQSIPGVPEICWLKAAIEDFATGKGPGDVIKSYLVEYGRDDSKRQRMMQGQRSEHLQTLFQSASGFPDDPKLKDLLFPRIEAGRSEPFRLYAEQQVGDFGLVLDWGQVPPDGTLSDAYTGGGVLESSVPLSWFLNFDKDWLGDLAKELSDAEQPLKLLACCGSTEAPHHRFALFWNTGPGFPNKAKLLEHPGNRLVNASRFSHVFIATAFQDGTKALVEMLPDQAPRDFPLCKVHFGETRFDFSNWPEGSAYLFAVKAAQ